MYTYFLLFLAALCVSVRAGEICCGDLGCFTDDPPFDHYRLPRCPGDVPVSYELFTSVQSEHGTTFNKNNIPGNFDSSKRTVLLVHGYMNDRNTEYLIDMKNAILSVDEANVIIVGWGGILDYPVAASSTRTIGFDAGRLVDTLTHAGANYEDVWCVGFSLGAHVCGHVGMATNGLIGRITGLDPAGPWFEDYDPSTGLNPDAAKFVDVIHTMAHNFIVNWGILRPVGHMDFYPNGGQNLQPGCFAYTPKIGLEEAEHYTTPQDFMAFDIACSHGRSVDLFIESILSDCFVARQMCTAPKDIPDTCANCNGGGECARMGYRSQGSGPHGLYYLETTSGGPFCKN